MKKRLGMAVGGAALAATLVGGSGFALSSKAPPYVKCYLYQARIARLSGAATAAAASGNQAAADRINAEIAALVAQKSAAGC